jgi:hypothetical protein
MDPIRKELGGVGEIARVAKRKTCAAMIKGPQPGRIPAVGIIIDNAIGADSVVNAGTRVVDDGATGHARIGGAPASGVSGDVSGDKTILQGTLISAGSLIRGSV